MGNYLCYSWLNSHFTKANNHIYRIFDSRDKNLGCSGICRFISLCRSAGFPRLAGEPEKEGENELDFFPVIV